MGLLQKIYEFFSKLGRHRFMVYPVLALIAAVGVAWYQGQLVMPTWTFATILQSLLLVGGAVCYFVYIRPRIKNRGATTAANLDALGASNSIQETADADARRTVKPAAMREE